MMKNKITFLVPGIMLGMSVIAAEAVPGEASPDLTVRQVNIGRQEILKDSDKEVGKARVRLFVQEADKPVLFSRLFHILHNEHILVNGNIGGRIYRGKLVLRGGSLVVLCF